MIDDLRHELPDLAGPILVGQLDDGLRVVRDGVVATDRVIVNGLMRVRPGIKVNAREENTPATPATPAKPGDEAKAG